MNAPPEPTGLIFNIQRFSIHDGPGIRTTVFFKGCSLRCFWCHNPEGLRAEAEIQFFPERCIACGECFTACPSGAQQMVDGLRLYDRRDCTLCEQCLEVCYTGALEKAGRWLTVAEVLREVLADRAFYEQSGGGVTLSGGDPLVQHRFSAALLQACQAEGLHTAVETAGNCRWEILAEVLPFTDLVMMDLKHMDAERHRASTGVNNRTILENAARLAASGVAVRFRTPVVPGVNDTPAEIAAIAGFVRRISPLGARPSLELLAFHRMAAGKYHSLGLDYPPEALAAPTRDQMESLAGAAAAEGIEVVLR